MRLAFYLPQVGLEPTRPKTQPLKLLRMPIPPLRLDVDNYTLIVYVKM